MNQIFHNKSKYDVSTCCLEITMRNKIWLKPHPQNNIYHFKENIKFFKIRRIK